MARPLSKTQKKIDNNIKRALAEASALFTSTIPGWQSLTHQADYSNFPASLIINCVFDDDQNQRQAHLQGDVSKVQNIIHARLLKVGVILKAPRQQITFGVVQSDF